MHALKAEVKIFDLKVIYAIYAMHAHSQSRSREFWPEGHAICMHDIYMQCIRS